ncbi:hypothetical protein EZV62_016013 [Acer yangbiense]|uniref:Retrovirus-related Pol polyprotein from transposon TNT 1-94-like beta-barrel domain-containing protein n=1 Tax=Acer yangbiense TaxID=1000413 RepID=A0A5C7HN08_9ROSI|nr:hypothetical protein EZV62_016013 [Acer yangbiense]
MKPLFKSQEIWDLVEYDYADPDENPAFARSQRIYLFCFSFDELMGSHEVRMKRSLEKNEEKAFRSGENMSNKNGVRCHYYNRIGHIEAKCWSKEKQQDRVRCHYCNRFGHVEANCLSKEKQANYTKEKQEKSKLFMAHVVDTYTPNDVWFLDSGCSNHVWYKINSYKVQVRLGDNNQLQVEGKGMVAVKTSNNGVKC